MAQVAALALLGFHILVRQWARAAPTYSERSVWQIAATITAACGDLPHAWALPEGHPL